MTLEVNILSNIVPLRCRIQDFPSGGVDSRGGYVLKILYVKSKETGPLGGRAPGTPPRSANALKNTNFHLSDLCFRTFSYDAGHLYKNSCKCTQILNTKSKCVLIEEQKYNLKFYFHKIEYDTIVFQRALLEMEDNTFSIMADPEFPVRGSQPDRRGTN